MTATPLLGAATFLHEAPVGLLIRWLWLTSHRGGQCWETGSSLGFLCSHAGLCLPGMQSPDRCIISAISQPVYVVGNLVRQYIFSSWTKSRLACYKTSGFPKLSVPRLWCTQLRAWCPSGLCHLAAPMRLGEAQCSDADVYAACYDVIRSPISDLSLVFWQHERNSNRLTYQLENRVKCNHREGGRLVSRNGPKQDFSQVLFRD